jgi:hypothetical protein
MANNKGFSPKYRIDLHPVNDGESWIAELYVDGEETITIDRMFISSAVDEAIDHVMDLYDEEYDSDEDF